MLTSCIKKSFTLLVVIITVFFLSGCEKERYYKYTLVLDNAFNTINKVDIFTLGKRNRKFLKKSGTTSIKYCSIWITNLTFRIEAITSLRI